MNTKFILASALSLLCMPTVFSQTKSDSVNVKKEEKIIIRSDGKDKEKKTIEVEVDGDKVTINGKPVEKLNEEDKVLLNDLGNGNITIMGPEGFKGMVTPYGEGKFKYNVNKAFLGVITEKDEKGAKITDVTKESAAEKSGLKVGDIITKVNETKIENGEDLHKAIGNFKPQDKVKITYLRDNKEATASVLLGKNKPNNFAFDDKEFNFRMPPPDDNFRYFNLPPSAHKPRIGLQIQDVEEGNGVKVINVDDGSPADKAGLKENDIITGINGADVKDVDDLRNRIKDLKEGDVYKIKYKRNGKAETSDIKIPKRLKTANL